MFIRKDNPDKDKSPLDIYYESSRSMKAVYLIFLATLTFSIGFFLGLGLLNSAIVAVVTAAAFSSGARALR